MFIVITGIFYSYKIIKKKINKRNKDILFFKANGIKIKDIISMINRDSKLIIILAAIASFFINVSILEFMFEDFEFNFIVFLASVLFSFLINKRLLKREIERKIRI